MSDAKTGAPAGRRNPVALVLAPSAVVMAACLVALRLHFQPPTVPRYDVTLVGGSVATAPLAEPPEALVLRRGGQFEIELHPQGPVTGAIGARAFLLRGDEVHVWDPPFSVAVDGVVRISGTVGELFAGVALGPWEVAVAVGRPEVLPTAPRDVLRRRDQDPLRAGWHLVRVRIRLDG